MALLVADARALGAGQYELLVVYGGATLGDGGGGFYVWNSAATNADDGAAWIRPTSVAVGDPGRWERIWTLPTILSAFGRDLIDSADATAARGTLGLGTIATQAADGVTISGGSITGITDLAIADGGTGASTAAAAFTALKQAASETATGVVELATNAEVTTGTDTTRAVTPAGAASRYQPLDADLTALAGVTSAANALPYFSGAGAATTTTLSAFGRTLIDDADNTTARTTLGLGAVATLASVDLAANITGTLPLANIANLATVAHSTTTRTNTAADRNNWVRWTSTSAKTFTIASGVAVDGDVWQGFNAGATGTLTIAAGSGVTLSGVLTFASGKAYSIRFSSASAADVIGGA